MYTLSKILVEIIKAYDPNKNLKGCITAPHFQTSGAQLQTDNKFGFSSEENLFNPIVREAVTEANNQGYNVDQTGLDEHEQDFGSGYYSAYDYVISNHFDSANGRKATLYTNGGLATHLNNIRNSITAQYGIAESVLSYRDDLQMAGMNNCVMFEWFSAGDNHDVNILLSQTDGTVPNPGPAPETPNTGFTSYSESGKWFSKGEYPVIAFPSIEDAIAFNDNFVINEVFAYGEIIAEYDTVYQDGEYNYIHWFSDNGENRFAPTSKIGGDNKIGYFE